MNTNFSIISESSILFLDKTTGEKHTRVSAISDFLYFSHISRGVTDDQIDITIKNADGKEILWIDDLKYTSKLIIDINDRTWQKRQSQITVIIPPYDNDEQFCLELRLAILEAGGALKRRRVIIQDVLADIKEGRNIHTNNHGVRVYDISGSLMLDDDFDRETLGMILPIVAPLGIQDGWIYMQQDGKSHQLTY